jgi:3-deoxy-manno-octulosonate cytidylyltransferase (CMP-KDO synthetase)
MSSLKKNIKVLGVIPARMSSGRFPGKPLARINSIPMLGHCYLRSRLSGELDDLYVATCDQEIFDYVTQLGGNVVMTRNDHEMCMDRVVEATHKIESNLGYKVETVINIQGDQPMVFPEMIDATISPLKEDPALLCSTMMEKSKSADEHDDPNRIKIVVDKENYALYMSREPIPSRKKWKDPVPLPVFIHVAITSFRREFLEEFGVMPISPLEKVESVDYLRILENGLKLKMVLTEIPTETVDTLEDLRKVEDLMKNDQLVKTYLDKTKIDTDLFK